MFFFVVDRYPRTTENKSLLTFRCYTTNEALFCIMGTEWELFRDSYYSSSYLLETRAPKKLAPPPVTRYCWTTPLTVEAAAIVNYYY